MKPFSSSNFVRTASRISDYRNPPESSKMGISSMDYLQDSDLAKRILFVPLSLFHAEQIKQVFMRNYVDTEPIYRMLNVDKASIEGLFQCVFLRALADECSCVAIDWQTNRVVATCIAICNDKLLPNNCATATRNDGSCSPDARLKLQECARNLQTIQKLLHESTRPEDSQDKENQQQMLQLENSIEVMFIVTEKDYRGKGIQSKLLCHVIDLAKRSRADSVVCVAKSPCTQRLLSKVGFCTVCCSSLVQTSAGDQDCNSTTEIRCCWMCLNLTNAVS